MDDNLIKKFINESNKIEGIERSCTEQEFIEFKRFINLKEVTVEELENFISIYQPGAQLRDKYNMNVRVGKYYPPFGGPEIRNELEKILELPIGAYKKHILYEKLHPFTDGNGRSGRMLWAWQMQDISKGFLHMFYYQCLQS